MTDATRPRGIPADVPVLGEPAGSARMPDGDHAGKGVIHVVHLYPREMSIYGDLGNTRCIAARIRRHGYVPVVHQHHPGADLPAEAHLLLGGGGQDSGQARVEEDLDRIGERLRELAAAGVPMLMICGMYQLFGNAFITIEGTRLPGLGILDVTTQGNAKRMIGPVVLDTAFGDVVGYENHSGSTTLGAGQAAFGRVRSGLGNNGTDGAYYLLVVAPERFGRWRGVAVEPSDPPLQVGEGARDGESAPLAEFLRLRLEARDDFP